MSNNESLGPLQVMDNSVLSINDALRQVQDRLDEAKGLRGRATILDRTQVSDPTEQTDAVNLGTTAGIIVTLATDQTITGKKTFTLPLRMVDAGGNLIHAFGTLT